MSIDETTLTLVRESARRFAARFQAEFGALEADRPRARNNELLNHTIVPVNESIQALMNEAEKLGWTGALDVSPTSEPTDTDAALLAAIAYELGSASPSWAARWLAHHVGRLIVDALATSGAQPDGVSETSNRPRWYGLDASCTDNRFAPSLHVVGDARSQQLRGTLHFVMGGDCATHWVAVAESVEHRRGIVLVNPRCGAQSKRVQTLGLNGLGVVEARLDGIESSTFEWLLSESELEVTIARSLRHASLAYTELMRALVEQAKQIAVRHAHGRRQHGGLLEAIPAVQRMLGSIDQALALASMMARAGTGGHDIVTTLPLLRAAAHVASDASLQVLGGNGYVVGAGTERLWRDVRQLGQLFFPLD